MKKTGFLFVAVLFFFAAGCGGSGTTTSNSSGTTGGIPGGDGGGVAGPVGTITVTYGTSPTGPRALAPADPDPIKIALVPDPTHFRAVVRKIETITDPEIGDYTTDTVWGIGDAAVGGSVQLTVPADTGYTVQVIATIRNYSPFGGVPIPNYLLHYGSTIADVAPGVTTNVTINSDYISRGVVITPPALVQSNTAYNAFVINSLPLGPNFEIRQSAPETPYTAFATLPPFSSSGAFLSPTVSGAGPNANPAGSYDLYFQGKFFIHTSMLKAGELSSDWVLFYPHPSWDYPVMTFLVPPGAVGVGVTPPPGF